MWASKRYFGECVGGLFIVGNSSGCNIEVIKRCLLIKNV